MIDELLLLSGNDIPFPIAQLVIHPPTIKQIAYISEKHFWSACQLLKFDKNFLTEQDKNNLLHLTNFNIIMSMVQNKNVESQQMRISILSLFALMFPTRKVLFQDNKIKLIDKQNELISEINDQNFEKFKEILIKIFCLNNSQIQEYNPVGQTAKKIADKLKKAREKKAKLESQKRGDKIAILSRYVSILAVGQNKDINQLMNYTVYQLFDQFTRFNLKLNYDMQQRIRLAGGQIKNPVEEWVKDIYIETKREQDFSSNQLVLM